MRSETNEPITCERCGIFYYEWLQQGGLAALGRDEPLIPNIHTCPEPYPYATAKAWLEACVATGMPVSQTRKARIRLGLASDPRAEGV